MRRIMTVLAFTSLVASGTAFANHRNVSRRPVAGDTKAAAGETKAPEGEVGKTETKPSEAKPVNSKKSKRTSKKGDASTPEKPVEKTPEPAPAK